MRAWWLALCLPAVVACQSPKSETEAGAAPSDKPSVPRINVADQKGAKRGSSAAGVLPGVAGETDGREVDAGVSFRAEAKKGCGDTQCVGNNCARLCSKWTNDNPPSNGDLKNKVYLSCLGTCLMEVDE